jgi:hypothetical protein
MCPVEREKSPCIQLQNSEHHIFNHLEPIEEIENGFNTPSWTTPDPPPPSHHRPQEDFLFYANLIQRHLTVLEKIVIGPHVIVMNEIHHLRPNPWVNHWKGKLSRLLFETRIPFFWVIDCFPADIHSYNSAFENKFLEHKFHESSHHSQENYYPQRVQINLICHDVRTKVYDILNSYLKTDYNNMVYLE